MIRSKNKTNETNSGDKEQKASAATLTFKKQTRRKLYLGVLVTLSGIFFIAGIFLIGAKESLFSKTIKINTIFTNINGLREGDYVRLSGMKVGIVSKISFINDSMIQVEMKIDKKMQQFLKKDALAYIGSEGLVGNKLINIRSKWKSRENIEDGERIEAVNPFNTEDIVEKLVSTNENAFVLTENLSKISQRMNESKGIFGTLINDTVAAKNLKEIIEDVKKSGKQLSLMTSDFERVIHKINSDKGLAGALLNDSSLANELRDIMYNLKTSSEYSAEITGGLKSSLEGNGKGTIGMLMKDPAFAESIRESVTNLQEATKKLNESMDALQHSFLLRKFFKKKK